MIFYNIPNAGQFFSRVLACRGDVFARGADGQTRNLKDMAEYCIQTGIAESMSGIREIDVKAANPADAQSWIQYAMQMRY